MTFDTIGSEIRDELDDNGVTYYSSEDIFDSMQDGYDEVATLTKTVEKMVTVAVENELVYYNLYNDIPDYYLPFAIWNTGNEIWLSHKSRDFFQRLRYDWEKAEGKSQYFSVVSFEYIAVYPRLLTATGNFEIFYNAKAPTVVLSENPIIPLKFRRVLKYYSLMDLLEQAEEYTKSQIFFQKYQETLNALTTHVSQRSLPDRINILREQFSGGSFYGR